jgi:hypothetical protein
MSFKLRIGITFLVMLLLISCANRKITSDMNILFLHHSTGAVIWKGEGSSVITKASRKISSIFTGKIASDAQLPLLFEKYNEQHNKKYLIEEMIFPKASPYGWNNYPFDYYNIWVKHADSVSFKEEPTLEMLTKNYQVIIFKHCFPTSNILPDQDSADIDSDLKTIGNYKLQYSALRDKLHEFPDTRFILFTGAVQVKANITEDEAKRAKEFFSWVTDEWDEPDDNIYLWDLYKLQTEGGLYFKDEFAVSGNNSHPNEDFAGKAVKLLFNRVIDIIDNNGDGTMLTGEEK